jgi:hypothetical protein
VKDGRLAGGWMSGARLVDGSIRRKTGPHTPFVHQLLRFLEDERFDGAPRVLGIDGDEEVLSYLHGHVPVETAPERIADVVFSDAGIRSAFTLIRRYHDVTAGCSLTGDRDVVCHGDLSPWNTVYDHGGAIAFIDWDNARPGERCEDVGYAVWRYLMLGFPAAPPLDVQRRQLRLVADTYGTCQPSELIEFVADAQRSQHDAFRSALAAGDERIQRLVELGALGYIEGAQEWLDAHCKNLL